MSFFTFSYAQQRELIGQKIGTSDWLEISQEMINSFGEITMDPDPMHMDPGWCEAHSPYGKPIAFGFLTISLLTTLFHSKVPYLKDGTVETGGYPLNYGFDKLRITAPVPVNSRIRGHFTVQDVRERADGELIQKIYAEIEIEGSSRPAMIAEWLFLWVTEAGHDRIESVQW